MAVVEYDPDEECMRCKEKLNDLVKQDVEITAIDDCGHHICDPCYYNNKFNFCPVCTKPIRLQSESFYYNRKWYTIMHSQGRIAYKSFVKRNAGHGVEEVTTPRYGNKYVAFQEILIEKGLEKSVRYKNDRILNKRKRDYSPRKLVAIPDSKFMAFVHDANPYFDGYLPIIYRDGAMQEVGRMLPCGKTEDLTQITDADCKKIREYLSEHRLVQSLGTDYKKRIREVLCSHHDHDEKCEEEIIAMLHKVAGTASGQNKAAKTIPEDIPDDILI